MSEDVKKYFLTVEFQNSFIRQGGEPAPVSSAEKLGFNEPAAFSVFVKT
ncbi:hypothetical protein DALLNEIH_02547 [Bacillus sp. B01(2024)]